MILKNDKEFMDMVVSERIMYYYAKNKPQYTEAQDRRRKQMDHAMMKLLDELPEEQAELIRQHEAMVLAEAGEEAKVYYRGGVRDGLRFKKILRIFLRGK